MKKVVLWTAAVCSAWIFSGPVSQGVAAQDDLKWILISAQQGNVLARESLAVKYYFGDGVPCDYGEAVKWVRLAVESGAPLAKTWFEDVHLDGNGTRSELETLRWLRLGAGKGNTLALELLGERFYLGKGISQDFSEALKNLVPAAEKGAARAQYYLGRMYARGEGVPRDYQQALAWLRSAAAQDFPQGQYELGSMYAEGSGVPADDQEAIRWLRQAAAGNSDPARRLLWTLAEEGRVSPENAREAREWLRAAAEAGDPEAQYRFGDLWFRMEGTPLHLTDYSCFRMAAFWFARAARHGIPAAQYRLAWMNLQGKGMDADPGAAFTWASLAAAQGYPEAGKLVEDCGSLLDRPQKQAARRAAARLQSRIDALNGTAANSPAGS